jgi:hypothetical protein
MLELQRARCIRLAVCQLLHDAEGAILGVERQIHGQGVLGHAMPKPALG